MPTISTSGISATSGTSFIATAIILAWYCRAPAMKSTINPAPRAPRPCASCWRCFTPRTPTRRGPPGAAESAPEPLTNRVRPEFLAQLDVVGYNYVDRWRDRKEKYYSIDRAAFPQRRVIGTESGSMGGTRGDYRGLFPPSPQSSAAP